MSDSKIQVAEMFAGVGGFHLALKRSNPAFDVVWADQWEPARKAQYAFDIYIKQFGSSRNYLNDDITGINMNDVPDVDMIVGGFPCQDYSVAHSGAKGIEGKKGVLWWDIHRMILSKDPDYIFLENVDRLLTSPGVRSKQPGRDFAMILRTLDDAGYGVQWRMINSAEYGFPQKRRRTYIFAFKQNTKHYKIISNLDDKYQTLTSDNPFSVKLPVGDKIFEKIDAFDIRNKEIVDFSNTFSIKGGFKNTGTLIDGQVFMAKTIANFNGKYSTLGDIIQSDVDEDLFLNANQIKKFIYLKGAKSLVKTRKQPPYVQYKYAEGAIAFPDPLDKPSRTTITSEHSVSRTSHVIKDPKNNKLRMITPEESEKLNTFPSGWTEGIPNTARYFTMGNALVVDLVKIIADGIIDITKKSE